MPSDNPLLQCPKVSDDVSNLLIVESALRLGDARLENRIVFVHPERRHQDSGLHVPGILDPEREVCRSMWKAPRADSGARSEMRQVWSNVAHRRRIPGNRVTSNAGAR